MNSQFTYGNPILFRTPVWVELLSDPTVAILLKPLSYQELTASQEVLYMRQQDPDLFKYDTLQTLLVDSVIDTRDAINFPSTKLLLHQIKKEDLQHLYTKLLEISTVSREQLEALGSMLDIQFNPQFNNDSWDCTICREKKLDYNRACGYLPKDKRDPAPELPRINGRRFSQCPISTIDAYVMNKAYMCHNMWSEGVMPEDGGVGEQTEWFVNVALLYKRKIAEAERASIEEHNNNK